KFNKADGTTNVLDIDTTNSRVGIGSATPAYTLDVAGTIRATGNVTFSGTGNTLGTITSGTWSGTAIAANKGGTGQTVYTVGDILYASTTTALSKLNAGTSGYVLTSNGAGAAPTWAAAAGGFTGGGTANYVARWTGATSLGTGVLYDNGTNVGIGTAAPNTNLSVYNANESTTLTNFTQALTNSGINIITNQTTGAYTPGIFWSTSDNNATKPKAGIWMYETAAGSALQFGTSNALATGITNQAMTIDTAGNVGIGSTAPTKTLDVVGTGKISTSLVVPIIYPAADGTSAIKFNKADGTTNVLDIDTTNSRVGIGSATPAYTLDVAGSARATTGFYGERYGLIGTYNSAQIQCIWSMGAAYDCDIAGNTLGTLYGMAYSYSTTTGIGTLAGHELIIANNGTIGIELGLTGKAKFASNVTIGGTLGVTGAATFTVAPTVSAFSTAGVVVNSAAGLLSTSATLDETLGGTGQTTYATGDILYASAANTLSKLTAGTSGYVLTAHGAGTAPTWAAAAGGFTGGGTANYVARWTGATSLGTGVLYDNGTNVGIGTAAPTSLLNLYTTTDTTPLYVIGDNAGGAISIQVDGYGSGVTGGGGIVGRYSRGTFASPSTVLAGDRLTYFVSRGYTGSSFESGSSIDFRVGTGTISSASLPSYISFFTRPDGATGRVEVMRIDQNGNVGIGTTGPVNALDVYSGQGIHIQAGTPTSTAAALYNVGGTLYWNGTALGSGGGGTITGSGTANYVARWTAGTTLGTGVLVDTGTYVGIGTLTPNTNLSVYNANESTTLTNFTQALTNSGINIITNQTTGAYTPGVFWSTSDNNATKPKAGIWMYSTAAGSALQFGTSNALATGITNQSMTIDTAGNVGIGSTAPTKTLDVVGTGKISTSLVVPIIYPAADGTSAIKFNKADGTTNVLDIDTTNSRVGIGSATPAYTLDVAGTIRATGAATLASTLAVTGNVTLSGTGNSVGTITSGTWSGTAIAANKGGTGQTVYTVGDILYASTTTALSKLNA
ncbi:MAG: hypothetical protein WC473_06155, partial [Patescibacteria group bacterium]